MRWLKDILYTQIRIGRDGKPFVMYKLRSLPSGQESNGGSVEWDKKIRLYGRFIRKWRIDELPQIYNILKGEMAVFGPRPLPPPEYFTLAKDIQLERNRVKPGFLAPTHVIIGPLTPDNKAEVERQYYRQMKSNCPLWVNMRYLLRIAFNVVFNGARGRQPNAVLETGEDEEKFND